MKPEYDTVVIGGGTAGSYFARRLAEAGHSVLVVEKDRYEDVGKRLDVFHIDLDKFERYSVPRPEPGDPDFIRIMEKSVSLSPEGLYPKDTNYPFLASRLTPFLHRLHAWAKEAGVDFQYETSFTGFEFDDAGRISGVRCRTGEGERVLRTRLAADCSGIGAVGRRALPEDYGMETDPASPEDSFYVVLRYGRLKNPERDRVLLPRGWTCYKTWIAPQADPDGIIIGIGQPWSFNEAERVYAEFAERIELPECELTHIERGRTPYRRPPYSLVADGFVVLGDSACITKPFSGEGITAAWEAVSVAAEVVSDALKQSGYVDTKRLWPANTRYFRGQGAKFAALLGTLPGAAGLGRKENSYLFRKDVIFSTKDFTAMNTDYEVSMSFGRTLKVALVLLWGVLTGRFSFPAFRGLLKSLSLSGVLKRHYEDFPGSPEGFSSWVEKAADLWKKNL